MSKPTPNCFCVHTGYFRNDRTLALQEKIGQHAFHVMPMLWAYAGENQMDGDVSHLNVKRYQKIFRLNNLDLTIPQTKKIIDALHVVGFIQEGKLHSWDKFNRQFVEFDKRRSIRQAAAYTRWQSAVENPPQRAAGAANTNGHDSPSKQLWMLDSALKTAKGKAKRELERQRRELLSEHTGVDLSEPKPPKPKPAPEPERGPGDRDLRRQGKKLASMMRAAVEGHNPVPE